MKILVVGCGLRPKSNTSTDTYVNLDKYPLPGVQAVFDLEDWNWGCDTRLLEALRVEVPECFDKIEAEDVLEHVDDPIRVVQRLGWLLKPGGVLWIRGPDARYPEIVWADLTHKRAFTNRTFDGFDPDTYDGKHYGHYHGEIKFKVVSRVEKNKGLEFTLIKRG